MDPLKETGFISAWIGVLCGITCFIILCIKTKALKEDLAELKGDRSYERKKKDTIILLIHTFSCIIFSILYCLYFGICGIFPHRFSAEMTAVFCKYSIVSGGGSGVISRYNFYVFMLWRIQASFREPQSLMLSKYTMITFLSLIHLWFILFIILFIFFILSPSMMTETGYCLIQIRPIIGNFNAKHIRIILSGLDIIVTVGLLVLFLRRLYQLTEQNERVNRFKKRTLILGIISTVSSILFAIANITVPVNNWRFFGSADVTINLLCVVFTYKLSKKMFMDFCGHRRKMKRNKDGVDYDQRAKQESTFSKQPNDSAVWDIYVKAQSTPNTTISTNVNTTNINAAV